MSETTTAVNDSDLDIYVVFHVPEGTSTNSQGVKLRKTVDSIFHDGYAQEYSSAYDSGGEIVYSFTKPLLLSKEDSEKFFEKLKMLFNAAKELYPHFTQSMAASNDEEETR